MVEKEELALLYDKKIDCLCCGNTFTSKKVRTSRLRLLKRDEDLLNHYKGINPIKYAIFICPKCGYAASESKHEKIRKRDITIIKENITPKWNPRNLGDVRSNEMAVEIYKLALFQGSLLNYSNLDIGSISLNIGWLYRFMSNEKEEKRFLKIARDKFIEAYNKESLLGTNMDDTKLSYLIAELSYKIEDIETSNKWFIASIQSPGMKLNPVLNDMARDRWRLIKDKIKENDNKQYRESCY